MTLNLHAQYALGDPEARQKPRSVSMRTVQRLSACNIPTYRYTRTYAESAHVRSPSWKKQKGPRRRGLMYKTPRAETRSTCRPLNVYMVDARDSQWMLLTWDSATSYGSRSFEFRASRNRRSDIFSYAVVMVWIYRVFYHLFLAWALHFKNFAMS